MKEQREMSRVRKLVFIVAWLVEDAEAYEGKTDADVEKEIREGAHFIPYVIRVEKVAVLDVEREAPSCSTRSALKSRAKNRWRL